MKRTRTMVLSQHTARPSGVLRSRLHSLLAFAVCCTLGSAMLASCGIDEPVPSRSPEADVRNYYAKLDLPKAEYYYKTSYAGKASTLEMEMLGQESYNYNNCSTYSCYWNFGSGKTIYWYYNLSADSAVDLGESFDDQWVDLQAPLALNKTWTFTRTNGQSLQARVTKFGATVKLGDSTYTDVVCVEYTGADVSAVKWFARGIGLIYAHVEDKGVVSEDIFDYVEYP